MSVIRVRRLGLCLLVVVLLLSVTVSAADSVVLVDSDTTTRFLNWVENIKAHSVEISSQLDVMLNNYNNFLTQFYLTFWHGEGDDRRSVATMLYSIEYFCVQFNRLLPAIETDLANIDEALRMTFTNSNGSSYSMDMASIVYNHIGGKLDSISNALGDQSDPSSASNVLLSDIKSAINTNNNIVAGTIASNFSRTMQAIANINNNISTVKTYSKDIRDFLMNEEDLETKESSKNIQKTFNTEFGSKDRTGDMSKLSGLSSGMTDFFKLPDVDISSMFDQVETGFSDWFTSQTAQAISVGGGSAAVAAAAGISVASDGEYLDPETPYLDAWDQEVQNILAGGDGEW